MRVISTTDLSRAGRGCYIRESISLMKQFETYFIIRCQRISGLPNKEIVDTVFYSTKCGEAMEKYYSLGGTL